MPENFPTLGKDISLQIQEVQQTPNRINSKNSMPIHIMIKLMKITEKKILKAIREK